MLKVTADSISSLVIQDKINGRWRYSTMASMARIQVWRENGIRYLEVGGTTYDLNDHTTGLILVSLLMPRVVEKRNEVGV